MTPEVENFLIEKYISQLRDYSHDKLFGFFKKKYRRPYGITIPNLHFTGRRGIPYRKAEILNELINGC